jgi:NitT/TauT family transport system substrate-binding protein
VRSSTRRTILWALALVTALALVAAAYLRTGGDNTDEVGAPHGPYAPDDVSAGCGRESATDPGDLSIGRPVARCAAGSPAADPLPQRATVRVAIPQRSEGAAPLLVADALHEFAAENLNVQIVDMPEDKAYAALVKGDIDAVVGGVDAPFLNTAITGSNARLVLGGPLSRAPGDTAETQGGLWATRSSLPDLDDWSTITDHAVATTGGTASSAAYPIETIFGQQQVAASAVSYVSASPEEAMRRLKAGEISLAWLPEPVAHDLAGNETVQLVATLPASESIEGTVVSARLWQSQRAVGLAFVRALIRTINTHLADGYDDPAREALAKAMDVSERELDEGPAPLFDWEIRTGTLLRIQRAYIELGSVDYEKPLPEVGLLDRTLYEDVVGGA